VSRLIKNGGNGIEKRVEVVEESRMGVGWKRRRRSEEEEGEEG